MEKQNLLEEYNALYDSLLNSARNYAIKSFPNNVKDLLHEYNLAKAKWDFLQEFKKACRKDVSRDNYALDGVRVISSFLGTSPISMDLVSQNLLKKFKPGLFRRLYVAIKYIFTGVSDREKILCTYFIQNIPDMHSYDFKLYVENPVKDSLKKSRKRLMDSVSPYGVVPSGSGTTTISDIVSYGNVVSAIDSFPDSFQKAVEPKLNRLKEIKKELSL